MCVSARTSAGPKPRAARSFAGARPRTVRAQCGCAHVRSHVARERTCGVTKKVLLSVTATRNPIPLAARPRTVADGVDFVHAVLVHEGVEGRVKAAREGGGSDITFCAGDETTGTVSFTCRNDRSGTARRPSPPACAVPVEHLEQLLRPDGGRQAAAARDVTSSSLLALGSAQRNRKGQAIGRVGCHTLWLCL